MADNVWAKIVILSVLCNFTLTGQKVLSADNIENERLNNNEQIEDIQGNFTKKSVKTTTSSAAGGGIYNNTKGVINKLIGVFTNNHSESTKYRSYGGAIFNFGEIKSIEGSFYNNYTTAYEYGQGGAINNNKGIIGNITADFINNYAISETQTASGGAIINFSQIGDIEGIFEGNYAYSPKGHASGGALANVDGNVDVTSENSIMGNIMGRFSNNYAKTDNGLAFGGAIINEQTDTIGNIKADFDNNYVISGGKQGFGGAILNTGKIGDITSNFTNNYAISENYAQGGAINQNNGIIGNITGNFISNYVIANKETAAGGAIINHAEIGNITGFFSGNYAISESGKSYGGAILNNSTIGSIDEYGNLGIINSSFINNYAKSGISEAYGGAIYTSSDLNIIADGAESIFSGNYTDNNGKIDYNAIYVKDGTLNLISKNTGTIKFDDTIAGDADYNLNLTGDEDSQIIFNNDVINANITLDKTNIFLGRDDVFNSGKELSLNSGYISMMNNQTGVMHLPKININGRINMAVDVDLANKQMDRLISDSYTLNGLSLIDVVKLQLLSDATEERTEILFADRQTANIVEYTGAKQTAYSPIYKYDTYYEVNPETKLGNFIFVRGNGSSSSDYNPSVLATATAAQVGAYATQNETFNNMFQHVEEYMNIPQLDRIVMKNKNKYAKSADNIYGVFSPLMTPSDSSSVWIKPYATFENVPLKNGPKVSNINYGTLIGFDTPIEEISEGFDRVFTVFAGYNGSSQRYSGIDSYQNGALLGGTVTLYKNNFFNATSLFLGSSVGTHSGMYGNENFTSIMAGGGNKMGYNFEVFDNKVIIQPSLQATYNFIKTFDYTNAAGVRINSDPFNALQVMPGIKIIGNTESGWAPYVAVNMVWNIIEDSDVKANDVKLPDMKVKPYVQYGVGVQKRLKDKFMAYFQAMINNGGRNGVSLTFGCRWALGNENL